MAKRKSGSLERELAQVLNRHCQENGSNTPDFLLAQFMIDCLKAFHRTSRARERWYGTYLTIGLDGPRRKPSFLKSFEDLPTGRQS